LKCVNLQPEQLAYLVLWVFYRFELQPTLSLDT